MNKIILTMVIFFSMLLFAEKTVFGEINISEISEERSSSKIDIFKMDSIENFKKNIQSNKENLNENFQEYLKLSLENNSINIFEYLVNNGMDIWSNDIQEDIMKMAIKYDSDKIVDFLLINGFTISSKLENEKSLLYTSVENNSIKVVNLLIKKKCNIFEKDNTGKTLLMLASSKNNVEIVKILLNNKIDIEEENNYKNTALMVASYYDAEDTVNILLENGAFLNHKNIDGETAIFLSLKNNSKKAFDLLMKKGANILEKNNEGKDITDIFEENPSFDIFKILLERKIILTNKMKNKVLFKAILEDNIDEIKFLISIGVDLNAANEEGKAPLSFAKSEEIKKLLVENGASLKDEVQFKINSLNKERLEDAIRNNDIESVKELVKKVDISLPNEYLSIAIYNNISEDIIDVLLNNNCYTEAVFSDDLGGGGSYTPLLFSAYYSDFNLFKKLIEHNADIHKLDSNGNELINYSYDDNPELASYIIEKKILTIDDFHKCNTNNGSLYYYFLKENINNEDISKKLLNINNVAEEIFYYICRVNKDSYDKDVIHFLIDNAKDFSNYSWDYLITIIENDDNVTVKKLLEKGMHSKESEVLNTAIEKNKKDIVELLISYGATVDSYEGKPPVLLAAEKDYVDILKVLIKNSANNINKEYPFYHSLVYEATIHDSINSVKYLLTLKPNLDEAFSNNTILNYAVANDSIKIIEYLLKTGYTVNTASKFGYTPLMTAVYNQDIDMVKYLLDKGANVNIKDKDGKTASSRTSNSEILKLLRKE